MGLGVGMAMAANKVIRDIRAAVCLSYEKYAKLSRLHNNANVITIGSRLIRKTFSSKIS